jgi:transposase
MMGTKDPEAKLFYQFSLEERVPENHLLRRVAQTVDLSFVRRLTARFYSHTGQPSIDPIVIFKMALLSYLYGITSERRLIEEIRLNLAYLWFIGYDLDERVPDHSVLSKARRRFGPTVYLAFFKEVVKQCEQAGLIRGDKLFADSTLVQANASYDSVGSRALVRQLTDIPDHVERLWADNPEPSPEASPDPIPDPIPDPSASSRLAVVPSSPVAPAADESSRPSEPSEPPETAAEPTTTPAESIETPAPQPAEPSSPSALEPVGPAEPSPNPVPDAPQGPRLPVPALHLAGPLDPPNKVTLPVNARVVSRVDPEAELVSRARVPVDLYYKVHAAVDAGRARIVTAVEVTGGAISEDKLLKRLVSEHEGNVGCLVKEVGADTKYGTVENYRYLEQRGIKPSIPMPEKHPRTLPTEAFVYDLKRDRYLCPNGQVLTRQGVVSTEAGLPITIYQAKPERCTDCPLKADCCPQAKCRSITAPQDGGVRARAAEHLGTCQAKQSIRRRQAWIETIFGDGKERRGLRRARGRGLDPMRVQALMTAIAQNVRQLALSKTTRPETGTGALEKPSQAPFFLSWPRLRLAPATLDHNPSLTQDPTRVRQQSRDRG